MKNYPPFLLAFEVIFTKNNRIGRLNYSILLWKHQFIQHQDKTIFAIWV